jgi:hypothetical protein
MHEQIGEILTAADAVLSRKRKIESAIQDGVAGLASLIANRIQSERDFRKLEAAAAIGEPAAGLAAAKKLAGEARAALDQVSLKLNGLRTALGEQGSPLVESYTTLSGALPAHNAGVIEAFEVEWQAASTTWNLLLGRRRAIEAVLGTELGLPEPVPAAVQIDADVSRPAETLAALHAALKVIANMKNISERQLKAGSYRDPNAVFKVITDRWESRGIAKGTLIIAASVEPGRLDQLIELEQVRPILDRDQIPGVLAAASKAAQIDKAAAERELLDSERRLHGGPDNSSTRRPDLEAEWSHRPSRADLAKASADIAAGIAAGVEERARQQIIDESVNRAADKDEARATKHAEQNKLRQGPSADPKPEWPDALH